MRPPSSPGEAGRSAVRCEGLYCHPLPPLQRGLMGTRVIGATVGLRRSKTSSFVAQWVKRLLMLKCVRCKRYGRSSTNTRAVRPFRLGCLGTRHKVSAIGKRYRFHMRRWDGRNDATYFEDTMPSQAKDISICSVWAR